MIKLIEKMQATASLYIPKDDLPPVKELVASAMGKNCSCYTDKKGVLVAYQLVVSLDVLDKIQSLVNIEGNKASKRAIVKEMSSVDRYIAETEGIV